MDIRTYLKTSDISVATFAETLGLSPQAVHRYITGERTPRRDVIRKIVDASDGAITVADIYAAQDIEAGAR